jgi:hypothetical protein
MTENSVSEPRHFLILPAERAAAMGMPERIELTWTMNHPASHYGLGVLLDPDEDLLDGAHFRELRDTLGATIETDQPETVCGALGVPIGEPGIDRPKTSQRPSTLPDNALQMALEAQNQSDRAAMQDPGSPSPPDGYPAIPDAAGLEDFGSAKVLGYHIVPNQRHTEWYYRGQLREPGDGLEPCQLDATMAVLAGKPIPQGWERRERTRTELYARVAGNPILLEQRAQALDHRYRHALATSPGWLFLAELPEAQMTVKGEQP